MSSHLNLKLSQVTLVVMLITRLIGSTTLGSAQEKDAKKSIEGVWEGGVGPYDPARKKYAEGEYLLTITNATIIAKSKNGEDYEDYGEGTYRLDPVKKTIDVEGTKGQIRGQTFLGIYSLEGDTLLWAVTRQGTGTRPTKLEHRTNDGGWLLTLKRKR